MRRLSKLAGAALVAGLVASGAPVMAQELVDAKKPDAIVDVLKGFGSARAETAPSGNPKITGRAEGKAYEVFFYGCTDGKDCASIQFWTYWDETPDQEKLNAWNKDTRYGKLYIDDDEDLVLEFDVNLFRGVHPRTLEDNADIWMQLMTKVEKEVAGS